MEIGDINTIFIVGTGGIGESARFGMAIAGAVNAFSDFGLEIGSDYYSYLHS